MKKKMIVVAVLLVALTFCQAWGASVVAHYSFDDSANLGKDDSGNGKDLSAYSGVPGTYSSSGVFGGAADFDGSNQGFLTPTDVQPDGSFTVASWVNFDTVAAEQNQQVVTMGYSHTGFQMKTAWTDPVEYAFGTEYSNGATWIRPGIAIAKDEWHHMALTFEAASGPDSNGDYTGTAIAYIDGTAVKTETNAKYIPDTSNKQCIGRRASAYLDGQLDEFIIYDGALSEAEVGNLAVPEPASIFILTIGSSVVMLRRKK